MKLKASASLTIFYFVDNRTWKTLSFSVPSKATCTFFVYADWDLVINQLNIIFSDILDEKRTLN